MNNPQFENRDQEIWIARIDAESKVSMGADRLILFLLYLEPKSSFVIPKPTKILEIRLKSAALYRQYKGKAIFASYFREFESLPIGYLPKTMHYGHK